MTYLSLFFDFLEQIMGFGLVFLMIAGFFSIFVPSNEDRYNGAGTLDQNDRSMD